MGSVGFRQQLLLTAALFSISLLAARAQAQPLDSVLRSLLDAHGMHTPDAGGGFSAAQIELGRALFFDRELSGNRDTACATCHHPNLMTADGLNLPVGVAPETPGTLGRHRLRGADRSYIPRHAPEAFNRGSALWTSMFWDSRVAELGAGTFASPAGADLLPGLESVVAVQAMFPVTSREEMRGASGDVTYEGDVNEIALIDDSDIQGIWSALMDRLGALDEYRALFEGAYPGTDFDDMTFAHAANAIAAFEISQFTFLDTPFDRYLQGDRSALTPQSGSAASGAVR